MPYSNLSQLPLPVLVLARESRLMRVEDICAAINCPDVDCDALLEQLVQGHLLRRVTAKRGSVYYWVTSVPRA